MLFPPDTANINRCKLPPIYKNLNLDPRKYLSIYIVFYFEKLTLMSYIYFSVQLQWILEEYTNVAPS